MTRKKIYVQEIARQISRFFTTGSAETLIAWLVVEGSQPDPDATLLLTMAFGDTIREYAATDEGDCRILWNLCTEFACISSEDAPDGDPYESLPLCGVLGISGIGAISPEFTEMALDQLQDASLDPRQRVREAVVLGIRDLLATEREVTIGGLERWVESGSWLSMRAVAASIVEPGLLSEPELADAALRLHRKILIRVYTTEERQTEDLSILKETLGYTLGQAVVALPGIGFEYLRQLSTLDDRDVKWIVRENLEREPLQQQYPETVRHIQANL